MQATERWSAIVELVDLLVSQGRIRPEDRDVVLGALRAREETISTGIGFGIAIPHASSDRVDQVVAAFGRSSKGIEFDSLDNLPVRFIVLFVVPKDQFQTHLRTLAAIAKFLNDRTVTWPGHCGDCSGDPLDLRKHHEVARSARSYSPRRRRRGSLLPAGRHQPLQR